MRRPKRQEADVCALLVLNFRLRHLFARRLVFFAQAIHVVLVIVWTLAICRFFIVAASTCEVRGSMMIGSRKRAVGNAVSIDVGVTLKTAQAFQVFRVQNLSAIELLCWISE